MVKSTGDVIVFEKHPNTERRLREKALKMTFRAFKSLTIGCIGMFFTLVILSIVTGNVTLDVIEMLGVCLRTIAGGLCTCAAALLVPIVKIVLGKQKKTK